MLFSHLCSPESDQWFVLKFLFIKKKKEGNMLQPAGVDVKKKNAKNEKYNKREK